MQVGKQVAGQISLPQERGAAHDDAGRGPARAALPAAGLRCAVLRRALVTGLLHFMKF